MIRVAAFLLFSVFSGVIAVTAQTAPLHPTSPPGTIAQDVTAYLGASAQHDLYRVITSHRPLGEEQQWFLSVYVQDAQGDYGLAYQSPSDSDHFHVVPKLEKGNGTPRYFPHEIVSIAGKGQLMGEPRDQVLVLVHESAADCGMETLSVLDAHPAPAPVSIPVQVSNLCGLTASVEHHTIRLRGPYYDAHAPAYKPTINNASATLRFVDGHWVEHPHYFKLTEPTQVQPTVTPLTHASPLFTPIFKAIIGTPVPSGAPQPPGSLG
ncbi:MAG: hypothetical protein M3N19_09275 [Candidatus Eremiobacteraeota bacterium]|nr:hypothetical protein [Candidatus Eremiobacteraeota bacterium]